VRVFDLANNPRVAILVEMLRGLSVADTPYKVLSTFAKGYWPLRPIDHMISLSTRDLPAGQYRVTRDIPVADVLAGRAEVPQHSAGHPGPGGGEAREAIPVQEGGFLSWAIAANHPVLIQELDVRDDPVLGDRLAGMGSAMVLPLFDAGEPRYWNLQFRRARDGFTLEELEQAAIVANLIGGTNSRLLLVEQIKRLNGALRQQFEEVARVQQALLPRQIPEVPGLEIATSYLTSDQAGGDYYDFFRFDDGTWGFLIADVSGHGAAAATIMAMLHGILHAYTGPRRGPDTVLAYANRKLFEAGIEGSFVTAFFAVYDPRTATVTYARSGHNPPLLKDGRTGAVRHLDGDGGLPLGIFEPYEIGSEMIRLRPQDTLILYTDGITEAFSAAKEMFGPERLDVALNKCSGAPDCVVDSVHSALYQHTGSRTRADDQTLVAIRYTGTA
jgi:sigma-B regulation protein RsbU (phosphoserine phosphatase)